MGNTIAGNANGIVILVAGVEGNVITGNFVIGNPPVQVSVNNPATGGVDIRNLAPRGSDIVDGNVCLTPVNTVCSITDDPRIQR